MSNIIGTDVSFWQYKYKDDTRREITGWIDFVKMRTLTPYTIIRAGQNLWKDIAFDVSWEISKKAGLLRGSYWFYDSRADPKKQAQLWIATLTGDLGELPLWADFEDNYGGAWSGWRYWYDFLEEVKRLVPNKEIGIYTGYFYWIEQTTSKGIPSASLEYFKQYPLWIANYGATTPLIPKPWDTWTFWQWTDKGDGKKYGVESLNIDLNYFNGDARQFAERFSVEALPEQEQPTPEPIPEQEYKVKKGIAKVGTSSNIKPMAGGGAIATLYGGQYVYGDLSSAGTDLIDFVHYYKADGTRVSLGQLCKVTVGNLVLTDENEPNMPIPDPEPEPEPTPSEFTVTVKATGFKAVTVDLEPE